jgi:uncharacterized protein
MPQEQLAQFCQRYYVRRLSVFGSAIRGKLRSDSDIDILVEFDEEHTPGLFGIAQMELDLSAILGRRADIRTPEDLSEYFRDEVLRYAEIQYQA